MYIIYIYIQEYSIPLVVEQNIIIKHAAASLNGSRRCNLCLEEKWMIMKADKKNLNQRSEIFCEVAAHEQTPIKEQLPTTHSIVIAIINLPTIN